ncbi:MAG: class I SAM-dependent methyltransferase [Candidatus Sulfotelmatobacter sp.]
MALLRCTACGSLLEQEEKAFGCASCGKTFPSVRGVLRFVDAQNYADSFGYQWQEFSRTQLLPDFAEINFRMKTGLSVEELRGKLVLDVGCGMGRFAEVATRWGAKVVGVDLSAAAEVAARNLADRDFAAFQADVLALPFAPETFDCIYSIGVLHHTPDCEKAFKNLPQYLKPGGTLAVWLYSGYNHWYRFSDQYRKITHRVPIRKLHSFLRVAVPCLYWFDRGLRAVPVVGRPLAGIVNHVFPVSRSRNPGVRVLDTLDWYSPQYQSKHTYEQVFRWFESCGFEGLTVADVSIGVKGRKVRLPHTELLEKQPDSRDATAKLTEGAVHPSVAAPSGRPKGLPVRKKISRTMRWLPAYAWQRVRRRAPRGSVHLMIAVADHFEPAIDPNDGFGRAPYHEQEQRLERWCQEYPQAFDSWRDYEERPFVHSYFYPAEQYDKGLLQRLALHCKAGWGEIETHLHHGTTGPDTEENTRRQLLEYRNVLASEHGALSYLDGVGPPRYAFVHGNFALANSAGGFNCGVDSEMQVLAETGCYADFTLPPGPFYRSHIAKINSLYECTLPLNRRGAHRSGGDLECGRSPKIFPLMVEGPLMLNLSSPTGRLISVENGSLTSKTPPSIHRVRSWKRAAIAVKGRPDWLFIKLQCHGMDPRDGDVMLGATMQKFLRDLIEGATERSETLHFVSAREMVNIILAATEGREGNPGEYRDYRLKRLRPAPIKSDSADAANLVLKG